ncbi:hypothetical protein [Bacillus sp. RC252]|uniref:hypothetical protein n=1 Tax=Bacillus sp. RC252 TaxID=3156289 RepID=UPI003834834C
MIDMWFRPIANRQSNQQIKILLKRKRDEDNNKKAYHKVLKDKLFCLYLLNFIGFIPCQFNNKILNTKQDSNNMKQFVDSLYTKKRGRPAMENTNTISKLNHEIVEGSIEALKEENERLRMEIDYLKKLKAFVQKKKKLSNKTKQK